MTPQLRAYFFNNPVPLINFITKSLESRPQSFVLLEAENYDFEISHSDVNLNNADFYVEHILDLIKISIILSKCSWGFHARKMQFQDKKLCWLTKDKWQNVHGEYVRISDLNENVDLTRLDNSNRVRARYRDLFQNFTIDQQPNKINIEFGSYRWTCDYQDGKFYDHDVLKQTTVKMNAVTAIIFLLHQATHDVHFGWRDLHPK